MAALFRPALKILGRNFTFKKLSKSYDILGLGHCLMRKFGIRQGLLVILVIRSTKVLFKKKFTLLNTLYKNSKNREISYFTSR